MVRSNLSLRFTVRAIAELEKQYRKDYKNETDNNFKGNVLVAVTLGVIKEKGLPEIADCIRLIKAGNNNCDGEQAELILERYLEIEENKKRGLLGAFGDLCRDMVIDGLVLDEVFAEQLTNLEQTVIDRKKAMSNISELLEKFKSLQPNKELGVEADTQETE